MSARRPEDCDRLFAECVNRGDLDGVVALYESNATFVPPSGEDMSGTAGIRESLNGLIEMKPRIRMNVQKVITAGGDLAVLFNHWSMTGTGADGKPTQMSGKAMEIVRRQPDGTWRFVVDAPFAMS